MIEYLISLLSYYEVDSSSNWGYLFYCSDIDRLPNIDLLFGSHWLEVNASDYVIEFGNNICAFCITETATSYAVLGDSLLRNYYVVHDMDNMKMGFAPLANSLYSKSPLVSAPVPNLFYRDYVIPNRAFGWWQYLLVTLIGGVSFMSATSYGLYIVFI